MESPYHEYNPWWEEEYNPEGIIERTSIMEKIEKWIYDKNIILLTGLRRVGKTTVMKLLIRKLIRDGINPQFIDKTLLAEVKYDCEINEKQETLFKSFAAKQNLLIRGLQEIEGLEKYFDAKACGKIPTIVV